MLRRLGVSVLCVALLAMLAPSVVAAPALQVDCASDPAALGTAISAASPGAKLVISGTCGGFLALDKDLSITGATPDATLVGDPYLGVLQVSPSAVVSLRHLTIHSRAVSPGLVQLLNDGTLTLSDLTISGGAIDVIRNTGTLTLHRSMIANNSGKGDAPIDNRGGTVTLIQSQITDNRNTEVLGAIANREGSTLTLIGSTVSSSGYLGSIANAGTMAMVNSAFTGNFGGRAPLLNVGTMTVTNSIVSDNVAGDRDFCTDKCGGGIENHGILLVRDSVVRGNQGGAGGGIYNGGSMTLQNSSVIANASTGNGGGIFNAADAVATVNGTVVEENGAGLDGGGIFNEGQVTLRNVTILNNTPNDCTGC